MGWAGWITTGYEETLGGAGTDVFTVLIVVFPWVRLCVETVETIPNYTLYVQFIICQLHPNKTGF